MVLELRIVGELAFSAFFPAGNILDQKSVSVEPREEDVADYTFDSFLRKLKRLSTHHWTIAEVKTAGISAELVCNKGGVGVVLFRF